MLDRFKPGSRMYRFQSLQSPTLPQTNMDPHVISCLCNAFFFVFHVSFRRNGENHPRPHELDVSAALPRARGELQRRFRELWSLGRVEVWGGEGFSAIVVGSMLRYSQ